jgi:phospholipase C
MNRREFLVKTSASLAGLAAQRHAFARPRRLPAPDQSGIDHIVVLMMENRSFDHILGWLPGANGIQAGLTYYDDDGSAHDTYPLAPDFQGCGHPDPDHSWEGGRIEYNNGLCDGWLRAGDNDLYSIGYYRKEDLPFLAQAAPEWTVCSRYFSAIMAPTWPNKIYQLCGVTDRLSNSLAPSTLPTIYDRLLDKGISTNYYFNDFPFVGLWGTKYAPISRTYDIFLSDCAAGTLPAVSFVDPPFAGEETGTSGDDHPFGDIRVGESFMNQTYEAVVTSPAFARTVFIINFDEWGGFFDHVAPDSVPDVDPRFELRGFRVPCLIISPLARRSTITHGVYDHTSILKMIEWRYGLAPLARRDAKANNIADALDFGSFNATAPLFSVPSIEPVPCP